MEPTRKRPRARTYSACHPCRARKIKCEGGRPICATCIKRRKNCTYDPSDGPRLGAIRFPGETLLKTNETELNSVILRQSISLRHSSPSVDVEPATLGRSPGGQAPGPPAYIHPDAVASSIGYPDPSSMISSFGLMSPGLLSSTPPSSCVAPNALTLLNNDVPMEPFGLSPKSSLNSVRQPTSPPTIRSARNERFGAFPPVTSNGSAQAARSQDIVNLDPTTTILSPLYSATLAAPGHAFQNSDGWEVPIYNFTSTTFLDPFMISGNVTAHDSSLPESFPPDQGDLYPKERMEAVISSSNLFESMQHVNFTDGTQNTGYFSPSLEAEFRLAFPSQPSLDYRRKTWWDSLLDTYGPDRSNSTRLVIADFALFFQISSNYLSFINIPLFYSTFCTDKSRARGQPSLALAVLALVTLCRSSELGLGSPGREQATRLRDEAQTSLEASLVAEWITPDLAQAALLLAIFEGSCHPLYHRNRTSSMLMIVDNILRSLGLLHLDSGEPAVLRFREGIVPSITNLDTFPGHEGALEGGCSCALFKFSTTTPSARKLAPFWSTTPGWASTWSVAETRKEEQRRIVWGSLTIATAHVAYLSSLDEPPPDLYITKPCNYKVLLPGEALFAPPRNSSSGTEEDMTPKNTIWALHARIQLLYLSSLRLYHDEVMSESQKHTLAVQAWLETERIESALDGHSCNIDEASMYYGREYIFSIQKLLSAPALGSERVIFWPDYGSMVLHRVSESLRQLSEIDVNTLPSRPYITLWLHERIARYLSVWEQDRSVQISLTACKALLPMIEYLSVLYPSANQRREYMDLHRRVVEACQAAGEALPPPPYEVPMDPSTLSSST